MAKFVPAVFHEMERPGPHGGGRKFEDVPRAPKKEGSVGLRQAFPKKPRHRARIELAPQKTSPAAREAG